MGSAMTRLLGSLFGGVQQRIMLVGLDAAGKTTMLHKLKLGEIRTILPTVGWHVDEVDYKGLTFQVMDAGGRSPLRPMWRHYLQGLTALIFMVDASDTERFNDAKFELDYLITQEEGKSAPLLVLANKADLPNADTIEHIIEQLGLNQIKGRPWHIQFTCATKGEGLVEGLDWLHQVLTKKELKALASQVSLTPLTGSP